jgi:DNA-binding IclR family transcriptional regulator
VIAALNVSVHASRATMARLRRDFLPAARSAAEAIEADLRSAGAHTAKNTVSRSPWT